MRTWLPLTPSTVTVTESPIIRVSPTRRVRTNIYPSPSVPSAPAARPVLPLDCPQNAYSSVQRPPSRAANAHAHAPDDTACGAIHPPPPPPTPPPPPPPPPSHP